MKFPIINTSRELLSSVADALQVFNGEIGEGDNFADSPHGAVMELGEPATAIEYINYQTPPLLGINFSDDGFDAFEIMNQIVADPWLNHGAIIAFHQGTDALQKINQLEKTNIVISVSFGDVPRLFGKVLHVIRENEHILFQRAIHSEFVSNLSGTYQVDPDPLIIPCYANLVANYLYNMGFIDGDSKGSIALGLTEMLFNAIEHGICGISSQEKTAYLADHATIGGLIAEKVREPAIAQRKVSFQYEIRAEQSNYVIADGGEGFDWRSRLTRDPEQDIFSLHGRGILLTLSSIDKVTYNESGDTVTLEINHRRHTTNTVPLVFRDRETVIVEPEQVVFRQGEESDFLYYIAEGEYRVEINDTQIATVTPSDILVGEMSFLLQDTRSATVIAASPGKLIKISKNAFVNSIKAQPYYGLFLAKLLAQRLLRLGQRFTS